MRTDMTDKTTQSGTQTIPSVSSAKGNGNPLIKKIAVSIVLVITVVLLWYINTGKSKEAIAKDKKVAAEAAANPVPTSIPPLPKPDNKPEKTAPLNNTNSKLPEPTKLTGNVGNDPISMNAETPNNPNSENTQPSGKSPQELIRERRLKGNLEVQFSSDDKVNESQKTATRAVSNAENRSAERDQIATDVTRQKTNLIMDAMNKQQATSQSIFSSGGSGDDLSKQLNPTVTKGMIASKTFNRSYLIAEGTFLDCALETKINSTVPGMTSCILTRNVYSDDGKMVLLDRGSKITGQYQGGIKQGQPRIFVLWRRVLTPNGVVISLNSPGTSELGEGGHEGYIDTHFLERFGGAIMISLVEDLNKFLLNEASRSTGSNNTTNNFSFGSSQQATKQMATEALKSSINIPPTLIKNQGEHINIYVARDLDFRNVYGMKFN